MQLQPMIHAVSGVASRPPNWTGYTLECMQSGCALPPAQHYSFGSIWQYMACLNRVPQPHYLLLEVRGPNRGC